jgi:Cu/Ag efflux protein CusF
MKPPFPLLFAASLAAGFASFARAADTHPGHSGHSGHAMPAAGKDAAAAAKEFSDGTVKKVDAAAGKLTIAHGPLKNLGMPPMTMVFKAKDPALLKGLKAGDAIRFVAEQSGNDYLVTQLQLKK